MTYRPEIHHRRSIRLKGYDYSRAGAYFVTICTRTRECLFGEVRDGEMEMNDLGRVDVDCWGWLGYRYPYVGLDAYVVMPNHVHGILVLIDREGDTPGSGGSGTAPTRRKPLGD